MDLRRWGWATLLANIGLVLTGGLVRLTGSGLGCPTWPQCTDESWVPHGALDLHEAIEFGNRTLTFVLVAIAIGTYVAARRSGRVDLRRMAFWLALGIPTQALWGGVTVLTDLNPWVVSVHLMVSMAIIAGAVVFLRRLTGPRPGAPSPLIGRMATATYVATWVAVYLGTIVTGSGPHAGDADAPRNGFDPETWSRIHAASVWTLVLLVVVMLVLVRRLEAARVRVVHLVLAVLVAQGSVGYVQYALGLPILVVELHLLGAAVSMALATRLWDEFRR